MHSRRHSYQNQQVVLLTEHVADIGGEGKTCRLRNQAVGTPVVDECTVDAHLSHPR